MAGTGQREVAGCGCRCGSLWAPFSGGCPARGSACTVPWAAALGLCWPHLGRAGAVGLAARPQWAQWAQGAFTPSPGTPGLTPTEPCRHPGPWERQARGLFPGSAQGAWGAPVLGPLGPPSGEAHSKSAPLTPTEGSGCVHGSQTANRSSPAPPQQDPHPARVYTCLGPNCIATL